MKKTKKEKQLEEKIVQEIMEEKGRLEKIIPEKSPPETLEESVKKQPGPVEKDITISSTPVSSLNGRFLLVNVGSEERPADEKDIKEIEDKFLKLLEENNVNCLVFVTHHLVKMTMI